MNSANRFVHSLFRSQADNQLESIIKAISPPYVAALQSSLRHWMEKRHQTAAIAGGPAQGFGC
jgi:hypothetical protein